jgi:hypothetical protein
MAGERTAGQEILAGLLGGITSALGGVTEVPAGTAAARPPVTSGLTIAGIPQKTVILGLVIFIGVLMFMRK